MIKARLVTRDTGVDLIFATFGGFVYQIGIGEHGPRHCDEIRRAACKNVFGDLGHIDSITGELAHKPALVTSLEEGHREEIIKDDITDWIVMTPVGPLGPSDAEAIRVFLSQFTN